MSCTLRSALPVIASAIVAEPIPILIPASSKVETIYLGHSNSALSRTIRNFVEIAGACRSSSPFLRTLGTGTAAHCSAGAGQAQAMCRSLH